MAPLLTIKNLSKSFNQQAVLQNVSFSLTAGKCYALVGRSGSGKSVLFHLLGGLLTPDAGEIYYENGLVSSLAEVVSYMQQKDLLLPYFSVIDNICLPLTLQGVKKNLAHQKATTLAPFFGLESHLTYYPNELSGGLKQRAALLRAILYEKPLLLMDEPFSALDALTALQIRRLVKNSIRDFKKTLFFITHNIDEALEIADTVFILSHQKPSFIEQEILVDSSQYHDQKTEILRTLGL